MEKVNLFIVGAPKCGTTSLANYLDQHDEIFLPKVKEPHYFSRKLPEPNPRFINNLQDYHALYKDAMEFKYRLDASVWYYINKETAKAINEYNPSAKILFVIRNPFHAIKSLYWHRVMAFNENIPDINIALLLEKYRKNEYFLPPSLTNTAQGLLYSENYCYYEKVKAYIEIFGRNNVKVITLDMLKSAPETTLHAIFEFLQLSSSGYEFDVNTKYNTSKKTRSDSYNRILKLLPRNLKKGLKNTRIFNRVDSIFSRSTQNKNTDEFLPFTLERLHELYSEDIAKLQSLIGINLEKWLLIED